MDTFEQWWQSLPSYKDSDKAAAKLSYDHFAGQLRGLQQERDQYKAVAAMYQNNAEACESEFEKLKSICEKIIAEIESIRAQHAADASQHDQVVIFDGETFRVARAQNQYSYEGVVVHVAHPEAI